MNEECNLERGLRALAKAAPQEAGAAVQTQLVARFRERRAKRRWAYIAGTAASLVAVLVLCLALWHGRRVPPGASSAAFDQASGFVMLPYGQSGVPMEQPVIVRIDIPVSELGAMGVPVNPHGGKEMIRADLLVGQDGVARAVRFVE